MEKSNVEKLLQSLLENIKNWAKENDLEYVAEKISVEFGENFFKLKSGLKFVEEGKKEDLAKKEFMRGAMQLNSKHYMVGLIQEQDYLNSFEHKGLIYTLVKINTKAPKYPLIYNISDGTSRKSGVEFYFMYKD